MNNELLFGGTIKSSTTNLSSKIDKLTFISESHTLSREIEMGYLTEQEMLKYLDDDYLKETSTRMIELERLMWEDDPKEYIRGMRFPYYLHYVGQKYCNKKTVSWKTYDILHIDKLDYNRGIACSAAFLMDKRFSPIISELNNDLLTNSDQLINASVGLSLEQIWYLHLYKFKVPFQCLINRRYSTLSSKRIDNKRYIDSEQLIILLRNKMSSKVEENNYLFSIEPYSNRLIDINTMMYGVPPQKEIQIPTLVNDQSRISHSIELLYWNNLTNRFVYFDPWPEISLLGLIKGITIFKCKIYLDINAELWEITANDFKKILVATFIPDYY